MSTPLLSIVLVNYNGEDFIEECLDSVFASKCDFEFQTILLDNASTDSSLDKIRAYGDQLELIESQENLGFSRGNNACFPHCQGKYTLLLNTDTVLDPKSLAVMIDFMEKNPKVGALSPKLLNTDGSVQVQGSALGAWRYYAKKARPIDFICGACLLTKKSILDEIGGLNADLFFYNDDIFFCKQLADLNYPIYYLPDTKVIHHGGLSSKKDKAKLTVSAYKGSLAYCQAFYPFLIYFLYKLVMLIDVSIKWGYHCVFNWKDRHKRQEFLNAYFTLFKHILLSA